MAWPTALAKLSSKDIQNNWDWGVRANANDNGVEALQKKREGKIPTNFEQAVCPSDRIQLAATFYPEPAGLVGDGDPNDPATGDKRYFGRLSYAINEDVAGADLDPANPSCWRNEHKGETNDPLAGARLEGRLDRIFDPASVIMFIDAGPDSLDVPGNPFEPNLIISAGSRVRGPYLGNFGLSDFYTRLPQKRHPKGQLNTTFADGHGGPVRPVKFFDYRAGTVSEKRVVLYAPNPRISPYKVRDYNPPAIFLP